MTKPPILRFERPLAESATPEFRALQRAIKAAAIDPDDYRPRWLDRTSVSLWSAWEFQRVRATSPRSSVIRKLSIEALEQTVLAALPDSSQQIIHASVSSLRIFGTSTRPKLGLELYSLPLRKERLDFVELAEELGSVSLGFGTLHLTLGELRPGYKPVLIEAAIEAAPAQLPLEPVRARIVGSPAIAV